MRFKIGSTEELTPVEYAAAVVTEAVTCSRSECQPQDHVRFVTENLELAQAEQNRSN